LSKPTVHYDADIFTDNLELLKLQAEKNIDPEWNKDKQYGSETIQHGIVKNIYSLKKEINER
jgi:hypothetical protein